MAHEVFKSRFTFVAAAVGMAVGTGNLWRFPRVVGEWGGGAFLIALVVANLIWAIPILMAESLLGSRARLGTVGAFRDFMGRKFAWLGGYMGFITVGILFYYAVVCGWALRYTIHALTGTFQPGTDTQAVWDQFVSSPAQTIGFQALSLLLVGMVVYRGLKGGFESLLKVVIPALFVILAVLVARAITLPGAVDGLRYMFVPEWTRLGEAEVWLQAFTQMAFSTGAGWGLYLTYAVYMRRREDLGLNAAIVCAANLLASLMAGAAVLCAVFAFRGAEFAAEAAGAGNQGLAFIYFAELLGRMPGGVFFAVLFFLALFLAGVSSLIAMTELATRNVMDMGMTRRRAVPWVVGVAFVAGIPSAYSVDFLTNQDNVWGIGLLLGGLCAAMAMLKYGVERARREVDEVSDFRVGRWWNACLYAFPVMFVVLFGWWILQSVSGVADWWNPFQTFSLGTLLLQWGALAVVMLLLNRYLAGRIDAGPMSPDSFGDAGAVTDSDPRS
ncbi:NSS family neurotransmitter:Na+ symporter [Halopolyspora algeriensis]|uniref:NSS family neurotransmitter:Na+ symporter n=1 Tax=Halopolyspora algeriensis TaxID=1500506 RepID=A0A368VY68_9ACTN|nr:sodium-dependent transporter [Halopolyspora algeriensis]RCW46310.1 NSS family neurotransmitter:Na+ symporter [Halopolyspora algeriensis]TQM55710.1 NSS family neurotransmitter:Na+ symporter [Halopolyspora algeriensis]